MEYIGKIRQFLLPKKKAQAIEVIMVDGKIDQVNYTIISKVKGYYKVVQFLEGISWEDTLKNLKTAYPISVYIQSDKTISKNCQENETYEALFPGLNKDNFWVENENIFNENSVTVTPKSEINIILEGLTEKGFFPYRIISGKSYFKAISSVESVEVLKEENQEIETYFAKSGEEIIPSNKLIGFLSSLQSLINENSNFEFKNYSANSFFYQFLSRRLALGFLGCVFAALLFNTLWYNNLNGKLGVISGALADKSELIRSFEKTQKSIEKKEKIISSLALENPISLSEISDRIGASIPNAVVLTALNVYPKRQVLEKKKKDNAEGLFISIEGNLTDDKSFGDWIKQLEQISWVKKVGIESYDLNDEKRRTTFKLRLDVT